MASYHLFERFGVEMEYMIVDAASLDVQPVADSVLEVASGEEESSEARFGRIGWSNELVRHVLEFKCAEPEPSTDGLDRLFQAEVVRANAMLAGMGCRLLPTGMHPWMDPHRETVLWPHGNKDIYNAFNCIFDCRGHGWSNLQSTHINLPFHGDDEFRRLHAAIRVLLPLLPAIAASTPIADAVLSPALDMRLEVYRHNCDRVPSITAGVVPERVASKSEYEEKILGRIYRDMETLDPEGILRDEWVNARGAIARFERDTIEIRVIDLQECPRADMAIVRHVISVLRALVSEELSDFALQDAADQSELEGVFLSCMREAGQAVVSSPTLLSALGLPEDKALRAGEIHGLLMDKLAPEDADWRPVVSGIVNNGTLAERILRAAGPCPSRARLHEVYDRLGDCLSSGTLFRE